MNPEERDELARLLPSPGEPVLPSDRHDLLKDHLMREFTQEVLTQEMQDNPQFAAAPGAARKSAPRRRFVMIAVPLATAAVAVAATLVFETVGTVGTETPDPKAVALLNRIAQVASAKEAVTVRDDQYVYVRTQGFIKFSDDDVRKLRESRWTPVDGKRPGLARITVLTGPPFRERDPFSSYSKGTHDMRLNPDTNGITFRELEALPTDPDALLAKIYDDTKDGDSVNRGQALEKIGDLLEEATLLPEPAAALYRAAAKIPGVSVVENAEDYAGRPGIGLTFKERDERKVWVFDKESLNYLGTEQQALLEVGVADGIGEAPGDQGAAKEQDAPRRDGS